MKFLAEKHFSLKVCKFQFLIDPDFLKSVKFEKTFLATKTPGHQAYETARFIRDWKSEIRDWKSETRNEKQEIRNKKSSENLNF
mgnify:CR=1 FL=1